MSTNLDLDPAARQVAALVSGVTDEQLTARTPCEAYTVADLLDHLMGLTVAFRDAGTKTAGASAGGPPSPSAANLDPAWRTRLPEQLTAMVAAWRTPDAWEGQAQAGGVTLPAEVMGLVAVDELVLHGWDLAKATGQPFDCDPATTEAILGMLSESDPAGTEGLFGPRVDVPADASDLDRALGYAGRDPSWTPAS